MKWLPEQIPGNVHIVVSTLPVIGGCLDELKSKYPTAPCVEITTLSVKVYLFYFLLNID
jgi:hypothetical protein